jgi:hypothetical protein
MSQSNVYKTLRVFNEIEVKVGKKDPSKKHGFQTCAIVKGEGRLEEFQMYFNPEQAQHFLPPGDYEVVAGGLYLDRDGRLQIGREFMPVKAARAA